MAFNYYADNAKERLEQMVDYFPAIAEKLARARGERNTSKIRWQKCQAAFDTAVKEFVAEFQRSKGCPLRFFRPPFRERAARL